MRRSVKGKGIMGGSFSAGGGKLYNKRDYSVSKFLYNGAKQPGHLRSMSATEPGITLEIIKLLNM